MDSSSSSGLSSSSESSSSGVTPDDISSSVSNSRTSSTAADASRTSETKDRPLLHLTLFALALVSTVWAGGQWVARIPYYMESGTWLLFGESYESYGGWVWLFNTGFLIDGLRYAVPLLGFLTVHEFGHYFAARYHRINTSLPYYIPFPFNGIGNFGAVISIRQAIPSTRQLFDVGAAGPLAGFVVAFGVLIYAFATLPPPEYLLDQPGHEALKAYIQQNGAFPDAPPSPDGETVVIVVGNTPLYWALSQFFPHAPPMYEMYHYPVLFAGWLGLFFTALNLLPVGQLDGGHILYALFGRTWHTRLARVFLLLLLFSGGIGFVASVGEMLAEQSASWEWLVWPALVGVYYFYARRIFSDDRVKSLATVAGLTAAVVAVEIVGGVFAEMGYTGWLIWSLLIVFLIRVEHPPVHRPNALTSTQRVLGYVSIAIFLLCFSFMPLQIL